MRFLSKLEGFRFLWTRDSRFRTQADFNNFLVLGANVRLPMTKYSFQFLALLAKVLMNIGTSVLPGNLDQLGYYCVFLANMTFTWVFDYFQCTGDMFCTGLSFICTLELFLHN